MILEEKSYRIRKIKAGDDCWELYPKKSKEAIKLNAGLVGNMFRLNRKWPWQTYNLKIKVAVKKCIVYAELDGEVLFDIPEEKYPENVKKEIRRIEKIEAEYAAMQQKFTDEVKNQLHDLLPRVPIVADLEDEINKLPVCWRAYLKLRLFMQYEGPEAQQRLFLTYHLVKLADRLYRRHTDANEPLDIVFRSVDFTIYDHAVSSFYEFLLDGTVKPERGEKIFEIYLETEQEIERIFPNLPKELKIYLNQLIHHMLNAYSEDYASLHCYRERDFWGDNVNTDSQAYRHLCKEMKLPLLTSLIIEKSFTADDIKSFGFVI
jgi:hypothetical protein